MHHTSKHRDQVEVRMSTPQVLRRLAGYLRPYKNIAIMSVIFMLAASGTRALPPIVIRKFINETLAASALDMSYFMVIGLVFFGIHVLSAFTGYEHRVLAAEQGQGIIRDLRKQVFGHLQDLSLGYYDNQKTGELMARVLSDVDRLEWGVIDSFMQIVNSVFTFGFQIFLMMYIISTELTLLALCVVPVMFLTTIFFNRKLHDLFRTRREKMADLTAVVQENISGIRVVKTFGQEDYERNRFRGEAQHYFDYGVKTNRTLGIAINLMAILGALAASGILTYGGWLVLYRENFAMGDLVAMLMYTGMLYAPIRSLVHANYHMQQSAVAAQRVFDLIDTVPAIRDAPDAVALPRVRGEVALEGVTFSYDDSETVLRDVDLEARPGEMVAFVGKSGAGKSTLVNLIPRLYDIKQGAVRIDGLDVRKIRTADLRKNISMVPQDVFLFNGTIRDNIAYGKLDATEEEIMAAAKAAHVDEFVQDLPDGYDTQIGERGIKVSGGQRQRISVARAILADAPILVLDEPTSNVDTHSERLIQEALERLMMNRTTFVIAHRLSTVIKADKIVLLDRGEVKAVGPHAELINSDPLYQHLYRIQVEAVDTENDPGGVAG